MRTTLSRASVSVPGGACPYGGVMVRKGNGLYSTIVALDNVLDGPFRIVGFGWELINTTPTMYKSGSILVYQCPQQIANGGQAGALTGAADIPGSPGYIAGVGALLPANALKMLPIPLTAEEATTLPSSKQWDSKHGIYCVPRLTEFDAPFHYPGVVASAAANGAALLGKKSSPIEELFDYANSSYNAGEPGCLPYRGEKFFTSSPVGDVANPAYAPFVGPVTLMPYTASGAHITGLSPESTFTLVATYFVQILPMSGSGLLSLV